MSGPLVLALAASAELMVADFNSGTKPNDLGGDFEDRTATAKQGVIYLDDIRFTNSGSNLEE